MSTHRRDGNATPLEAWIRNNPKLQPYVGGLSVTDSDWWIHQFATDEDKLGKRNFQNLMFVELKTFGRKVPFAQSDTLWVINQALIGNSGKARKFKTEMFTSPEKRMVRVWGAHVLRMDGACPLTSTELWWDDASITLTELEELLLFHRSPITRRLRTERRHHANRKPKELFQ